MLNNEIKTLSSEIENVKEETKLHKCGHEKDNKNETSVGDEELGMLLKELDDLEKENEEKAAMIKSLEEETDRIKQQFIIMQDKRDSSNGYNEIYEKVAENNISIAEELISAIKNYQCGYCENTFDALNYIIEHMSYEKRT